VSGFIRSDIRKVGATALSVSAFPLGLMLGRVRGGSYGLQVENNFGELLRGNKWKRSITAIGRNSVPL
jgi:hypothetical protein